MRTLLSYIFLVSVSRLAFGQLAEPLQFQDKIHDFGEVAEHNGSVTHEFSFLNKSARPVVILSVQPSCGCTTPGWFKEPIAPGKTGFIKASFDPRGRPGYFNKSLTVSTDLDANAIVLQIKGNVVDNKSETGPSDLVIENGNLRFRNSSFNVGKVFINKEPTWVEFPFYNNGTDSVKLLEVITPSHIKLNIPKFILPHSSGKIKISYDARIQGQYGFCTNHIVIKTNDPAKPEKPFVVYATVEEFFAVLTAEERSKAPSLVVSQFELDMGKMRMGVEVMRSVRFKNKGNKELHVRHIQSNCSCLVVTSFQFSLKPGEETSIEFKFDPTGREGLQNKALTIYSNDPVNPVQRITVKGFIEN